MVDRLATACNLSVDGKTQLASDQPDLGSEADGEGEDEEIGPIDNKTVICLDENVAFFHSMCTTLATVKVARVFRQFHE